MAKVRSWPRHRGALGQLREAWPVAFAVCLTCGVGIALSYPAAFRWFQVDANVSLCVAVFSIGFSLGGDMLWQAAAMPSPCLVPAAASGLFVFPVVAALVCMLTVLLGQPPSLVIGLALLAGCPPGSGSNLVPAASSGADLGALALICTASTVVAGVSFPAIVTAVAAAAAALAPGTTFPSLPLQSCVQIAGPAFFSHAVMSLLLPLLVGTAVRAVVGKLLGAPEGANSAGARMLREVAEASPAIAACMVLLTATNKTAHNANLTYIGWPAGVLLVVVIHAASYALGFYVAKLSGCSEKVSVACSIQAGARNPAVGVVLAAALLPTLPLAAAPCAISIYVQNVLGSWLALLSRALPATAGRRPRR